MKAKTLNTCAWAFGISLLLLVVAIEFLPSAKPLWTVAPPTQIISGSIILLRNGQTNAAVIIRNQSIFPERVDYLWYLRSDGKTTFPANDPNVLTGSVKGATSISVGSLNVNWSIAGVDTGWIYYPSHNWSMKMPWGKYWSLNLPFGPSIALTTEHDIAKIDAKDTRWKFMHGP